jgi:hypothetical protein
VTTNQILIGIGLILVLAVGAQVLATRLHIPALIVLLPAGFIAGALTMDVNPERLLGPAFEPLVSLSVAVILYDAGLGLDLRKLKGHVRKVVIGDGMTRPAVCGRYDDGARIIAQPANGVLPTGHDVLFLVRADGQLVTVTQTGTMVPQGGDTVVSLGPVPVGSSPAAGDERR